MRKRIIYRFRMIRGSKADYSERFYRISGEFIVSKIGNIIVDIRRKA